MHGWKCPANRKVVLGRVDKDRRKPDPVPVANVHPFSGLLRLSLEKAAGFAGDIHFHARSLPTFRPSSKFRFDTARQDAHNDLATLVPTTDQARKRTPPASVATSRRRSFLVQDDGQAKPFMADRNREDQGQTAQADGFAEVL